MQGLRVWSLFRSYAATKRKTRSFTAQGHQEFRKSPSGGFFVCEARIAASLSLPTRMEQAKRLLHVNFCQVRQHVPNSSTPT